MAKKQEQTVEHFAVIRWSEEDVKKMMELRGVPVTEENIKVFMNSAAPEVLRESSAKHGWEIIANGIDGLVWNKAFEGVQEK